MFGIHARQGLVSRSRLLCLALSSVLVLAVVGADADGPPVAVNGEAWASIQEQFEVEHHRVVESDRPGRLWRADNPTQRFSAHFGAEDVVLTPRGSGETPWELGIRLASWGSAGNLQPVHPANAFSEANRVEYRRGPLTEWYVNTTMGLEQGFTIAHPPEDGIRELILEMTLDGELTAQLSGGGTSVLFKQETTGTTLAYTGLASWDAAGKPLEARMWVAAAEARLRLVVEVDGASWPITVDPIFTLVAKLLPTPDLNTTNARFGSVVVADGEVMMARQKNLENGDGSYAVHVFHRDHGGIGAWGHVAKIVADDAGPFDYFGTTISISGDTAILGGKDAAYIVQRDHGGQNAWGQVTKINPSGTGHVYFGRVVSIDGDTAVVGDAGHFVNGIINVGSAFVYRRDHGGPNAWGQVAMIVSEDGEQDYFGGSVSISGETVIVGATGVDAYGSLSGSAYVFLRNHGGSDAWGKVATVTDPDAASGSWFGSVLSISGDIAIVGGSLEIDPGFAYIFHRDQGGPNEWGQVTKLRADDLGANDPFVISVSMNGDDAIIGAPYEDSGGSTSGSAYLFKRNQGGADNWGQVAKLTSGDETGGWFGKSVSISGDVVAVGDSADRENGSYSGSTYIFERDPGIGNWHLATKHPCPPTYHAEDEYFGRSVVLDGNTAFVGAKGVNPDDIFLSGSVFVFRQDLGGPNAWGLVDEIIPSDSETGDDFGISVAVDADTAIVGASGDDDVGDSGGSAYILQRDHGGTENWGLVAKITALDGSRDDGFGSSVGISGDTAIVGASGDDDLGSRAGSVYILQRDHGGTENWGQIAKVTALDGSLYDRFGSSVGISGDTAVVGATDDDDHGSDSGSAYVFQRDHGGSNAWGQVAKITPDDGTEGDEFGASVSVSGDTIIVGAHRDDDVGSNSGSAYMFSRNQGGLNAWGLVSKVLASNGSAGDRFGWSVALEGNTAVIGAFLAGGNNGENSGAAYVFRCNQGGIDTWSQIAKITAPDGAGSDYFGISVSINGDKALVGAYADDDLGDSSGSAYIFTISDAFFADGFETGDTSDWSATVP